jgi:hypothetical protein
MQYFKCIPETNNSTSYAEQIVVFFLINQRHLAIIKMSCWFVFIIFLASSTVNDMFTHFEQPRYLDFYTLTKLSCHFTARRV